MTLGNFHCRSSQDMTRKALWDTSRYIHNNAFVVLLETYSAIRAALVDKGN